MIVTWHSNSMCTYIEQSSSIFCISSTFLFNTRTTHAHDASRRAVPVRIVHVDRPCGAKMPEISRSSRTTTVESSMKSEHNL